MVKTIKVSAKQSITLKVFNRCQQISDFTSRIVRNSTRLVHRPLIQTIHGVLSHTFVFPASQLVRAQTNLVLSILIFNINFIVSDNNPFILESNQDEFPICNAKNIIFKVVRCISTPKQKFFSHRTVRIMDVKTHGNSFTTK